jgi:large subunit ribosomal protein L3
MKLQITMKKYILGEKIQMTQYFDSKGIAHAATLISATPITVTQVKSVASDGYDAVQVSSGTRNEKNLSKPVKGHYGDLGNFRYTKEFLVDAADLANYTRGNTMNVDQFAEGDMIRVSGISKGKGFQGVVKRHGFHGGRRTHGQKHSEREPGSIGAGGMQRVMKGMRMAGRMGTDRITVKNLKVLAVDPKTNIIVIKGAVPGRRGTMLEITQ